MGSNPINSSDILEGNLNAPQSFGNLETFTVRVPIEWNATVASFAFAVQAVDDVGLTSNISNVVQATLRAYIPPPSKPDDPDKLSAGAIAGITIACVVACALLTVSIAAAFVTRIKIENYKANTVTPESAS